MAIKLPQPERGKRQWRQAHRHLSIPQGRVADRFGGNVVGLLPAVDRFEIGAGQLPALLYLLGRAALPGDGRVDRVGLAAVDQEDGLGAGRFVIAGRNVQVIDHAIAFGLMLG